MGYSRYGVRLFALNDNKKFGLKDIGRSSGKSLAIVRHNHFGAPPVYRKADAYFAAGSDATCALCLLFHE